MNKIDAQDWSEADFRKSVDIVLKRVEAALEPVDPDIAECEVSLGALAIILSNGAKCIVSAQPSVRQIWLANAAKGVAFHFDFSKDKGVWLDDKGQDVELFQALSEILTQAMGRPFKV